MTRDRPSNDGIDTQETEGFDVDSRKRKPMLIRKQSDIDMSINGSIIGNSDYQGRYAVDGAGIFSNTTSGSTTDTYGTASLSFTATTLGILGFKWSYTGIPFGISASSPGTDTTFTHIMSFTNYGSWPENRYKYPMTQYYLSTGILLTNSTFKFSVQRSMTANESISPSVLGLSLGPLPFGSQNAGYRFTLMPTLSPTNFQLNQYLKNISTTFNTFVLQGSIGYHSISTLGEVLL